MITLVSSPKQHLRKHMQQSIYVTINIPLLPAVLQTIGYYILEHKDSVL